MLGRDLCFIDSSGSPNEKQAELPQNAELVQ